MFRRLAALAFAVAAVPLPALAQRGGTAHLYAYRVHDRQAFEAGYRRHLEWHARKGDTLAWFAWYVSEGERSGAFIDGTFGTTPEALAARPDQSGDAADFRANAAPFATAIGDEGWELWRAASSATPIEDGRPDRAIRAIVYAAIDAQRFEAELRTHWLARATWYRASGSGPGSYLLLLPADASPPRLVHGAVRRSERWTYAPRLALVPGTLLAP